MTQPPANKEFLEKLDQLIARLSEAEQFTHRLDRLSLFIQKTEIADILLNYTRPRRLFFTNFLAGLARGLGLTLGTAIVLVILGSIVKQFVSIPIIGDYIAQIVEYVNSYYVR